VGRALLPFLLLDNPPQPTTWRGPRRSTSQARHPSGPTALGRWELARAEVLAPVPMCVCVGGVSHRCAVRHSKRARCFTPRLCSLLLSLFSPPCAPSPRALFLPFAPPADKATWLDCVQLFDVNTTALRVTVYLHRPGKTWRGKTKFDMVPHGTGTARYFAKGLLKMDLKGVE